MIHIVGSPLSTSNSTGILYEETGADKAFSGFFDAGADFDHLRDVARKIQDIVDQAQ